MREVAAPAALAHIGRMAPNEIDQRRKRLPIGIQTFATLRGDGCYYVDKTPHIEKLLSRGSRYFLSRPRRFGKSLLLDTMKELFEGNEPLFRGLHIHNRWEVEQAVRRCCGSVSAVGNFAAARCGTCTRT